MLENTSRFGLLFLAILATGCGDDATEDGDDDGTAEDGASIPPLTQADCPAKPENVAITPVAPFWEGLVLLEFTQGGKGSIGYQDIQILDPVLGLWSYGGVGNANQRQDGSYVAFVTPSVTKQNRDGTFKLRVRSQLTGCAPSDWAESPTFTLGDPLAGSTWIARFGAEQSSAYIAPSITSGTGTTLGPYWIDDASPPRHTVEFHADGTLAETFEFGIQSQTAGDKYAGCTFKVAVAGTWAYEFTPSPRVLVSERHLTSTAGSSCTNPPLAEIDLNRPGYDLSLEPTALNMYNFNYTGLLYSPPDPATWSDSNIAASFAPLLYTLSDNVGMDTVNMSGSFAFYSTRYEKQ